jgi:hypothetical protein
MTWNSLPSERCPAVMNMLRSLFDSQVAAGYLRNVDAMRPRLKGAKAVMPAREKVLDYLFDPSGLRAVYGEERFREAAHAILDAWLDDGTEKALIQALKLRPTPSPDR